MADPKHLQRLLDNLDKPTGRREWVDFKLRISFMDLSTADFTERPLAHYDLSEVNLSAAIFLGADLTGADLSEARMAYADLRRATMRDVCLRHADLSGANLSGVDLTDAAMEHSQLPRSRMMDANLTGADLSDADLTGADLRGAILKYARLAGTKLEGADVAGADLTGVVMDDTAPAKLKNFAEAVVDDRKYRVMRSRKAMKAAAAAAVPGDPLSGQSGDAGDTANGLSNGNAAKARSAAAAAGAAKPGASKSGRTTKTQGDDPHEQTGSRNRARKKSAALEVRPPKLGPQQMGTVRFEEGIPIREHEPDLRITEVCAYILEIEPGAESEAITKAFRAKAKAYHPDKVRRLSERLQHFAADEFQRVFKAYENLTHRTTRPLVGITWPDGVAYKAAAYDYTVEEYEKLAAANPKNTSVLYNLAWKQYEASLYHDALHNFQKVLELSPNDEDAQYNLMIVRLFVEIALPAR